MIFFPLWSVYSYCLPLSSILLLSTGLLQICRWLIHQKRKTINFSFLFARVYIFWSVSVDNTYQFKFRKKQNWMHIHFSLVWTGLNGGRNMYLYATTRSSFLSSFLPSFVPFFFFFFPFIPLLLTFFSSAKKELCVSSNTLLCCGML